MVHYRIYSVYLHFGLGAELKFQYSHPIFPRQYGFVSRRLPDSSVSECVCRLVRKYRMFGMFVLRLFPAILHHHRHHLLPCQCPSFSGSLLSLVFRRVCPVVVRTNAILSV